jgi:hypothetical protein
MIWYGDQLFPKKAFNIWWLKTHPYRITVTFFTART